MHVLLLEKNQPYVLVEPSIVDQGVPEIDQKFTKDIVDHGPYDKPLGGAPDTQDYTLHPSGESIVSG